MLYLILLITMFLLVLFSLEAKLFTYWWKAREKEVKQTSYHLCAYPIFWGLIVKVMQLSLQMFILKTCLHLKARRDSCLKMSTSCLLARWWPESTFSYQIWLSALATVWFIKWNGQKEWSLPPSHIISHSLGGSRGWLARKERQNSVHSLSLV